MSALIIISQRVIHSSKHILSSINSIKTTTTISWDQAPHWGGRRKKISVREKITGERRGPRGGLEWEKGQQVVRGGCLVPNFQNILPKIKSPPINLSSPPVKITWLIREFLYSLKYSMSRNSYG